MEPYECCDLLIKSRSRDPARCEPTCFFESIDLLTVTLWKIWTVAQSSYTDDKKITQYGVDIDRFSQACWIFRVEQEEAEDLLNWMSFIADSVNRPFDNSLEERVNG